MLTAEPSPCLVKIVYDGSSKTIGEKVMAGIRDIADKAGVSLTTDSNVLNKKKNVGAETRQ